MRVKEGNVLQVTTNPFTTEGMIRKILTEHIKEIERMYEFQKKKESYEDKFYYLGKEYDVVGTNEKEVRLGTSKVFIPKENVRDLSEVPQEIRDRLKIVPVQKVAEVLEKTGVLEKKKKGDKEDKEET